MTQCEQCPRCGYGLTRLGCPICGGKQIKGVGPIKGEAVAAPAPRSPNNIADTLKLYWSPTV